MANEAVFKYLNDTNRPYSCADITVNLRGAFGKTAVQKALDALSESGKIKCKLYGKQKVYAAIQIDAGGDDSDIADFDNQLHTLTKTNDTQSELLKTAESKLRSLTSQPTNEVAANQVVECTTRISAMGQKLEVLRSSTSVLSEDEKKTILDEHEKLLREYRKRKRISSDMLEAILEGYPKSKKTLIEELCIETDEMANFKLMST